MTTIPNFFLCSQLLGALVADSKQVADVLIGTFQCFEVLDNLARERGGATGRGSGFIVRGLGLLPSLGSVRGQLGCEVHRYLVRIYTELFDGECMGNLAGIS